MAPSLSLLAACAIFASSLVLVSCGEKEIFTPNPNNPEEQTLPSAPFTVKVCVTEPGIDRDSVYVFGATVSSSCTDGKVTFTSVAAINPKTGQPSRTFNVTPDVVELALTPWNSITFEMSSDVKVNASSSADVADIVALNGNLTKYTLKPKKSGSTIDTGSGDAGTVQAIADGYTDVRFWNGTSASGNENSITIRVRTANHIAVEGFEVKFDGKPFTLVPMQFKYTLNTISTYDCTIGELPNIAYPFKSYELDYYDFIRAGNEQTQYPFEKVYDMSKVKEIEFVGTVPRNATPDNVILQTNDPVSYGHHRAWTYKHQVYDWNRTKYGEFRWAPFHEEYRKPSSTVVDGRAKFNVYPADLRYRKAQIWDLVDAQDPEKNNVSNFYFCYETQNGGSSTYWWGCIVNEPGKRDN